MESAMKVDCAKSGCLSKVGRRIRGKGTDAFQPARFKLSAHSLAITAGHPGYEALHHPLTEVKGMWMHRRFTINTRPIFAIRVPSDL